jgi:hypothetical protein
VDPRLRGGDDWEKLFVRFVMPAKAGIQQVGTMLSLRLQHTMIAQKSDQR